MRRPETRRRIGNWLTIDQGQARRYCVLFDRTTLCGKRNHATQREGACVLMCAPPCGSFGSSSATLESLQGISLRSRMLSVACTVSLYAPDERARGDNGHFQIVILAIHKEAA